MEDLEKKINELTIMNQIKDSAIIELSNLIAKLTTEIERYYITKKEHEKIVGVLKGK